MKNKKFELRVILGKKAHAFMHTSWIASYSMRNKTPIEERVKIDKIRRRGRKFG